MRQGFPSTFFSTGLCGCLLAGAALAPASAAERFIWQQDHATVLPNGDLEWKPEPYTFTAGSVVKYIDYADGDDNGDGSRANPWKHHPWDDDARGQARGFADAATFVFKGGVTYRGSLDVDSIPGTAREPIRLTRDPAWGDGPARIYGSEIADGWQQGGTGDMPEQGQIWHTDLDFAPRCVWMVNGDDITRLDLARTPNWKETDPDDVMSEWWTWENPQWWKNGLKGHTVKVRGKQYHLGIDRKNLTRDAKDYLGAYAWTEWGIVMGSPFPSEIKHYDARQKAINLGGPWNDGLSEAIIRNNRYYLEDKAWMLDSDGEFWFDKQGNGGRLYLRLPDGGDPNEVIIEAARHNSLISVKEAGHIEISGLTMRFTNVMWDLDNEKWRDPTNTMGAILMVGHDTRGDVAFRSSFSAEGVTVRHNTFEHVNGGLVMDGGETGQIGTVRVHDNVITDTDHGAIEVGGAKGDDRTSNYLRRVDILRNRVERIGWRNVRGTHGHAITAGTADELIVAGNVLHRTAGWGIGNWGGKRSGQGGEVPLSRQLIFQNRVEDPLLKSNDWGGIETWQGGPHYVWGNVSINPGGFKNWSHKPDKKEGTPRFGFAYYLDGSFKNYLFNNIAIGKNNEIGNKYANTSAIQGIIGFQNTFANNTLYKFVTGSRQQAPDAGRYRYLGNIWQDISDIVFRHAKRAKKKDANAAHVKDGDNVDFQHLAYADNVFHNIPEVVAVFEKESTEYDSMDAFTSALGERKVMMDAPGPVVEGSLIQNPDAGDFRPTDAAMGHSTRIFAPWALSATVGEWNFLRNNADINTIVDDHWFMTEYYTDRATYKDTPRYPLQGENLRAEQFVDGVLEDWTQGALQLEADQALRISHDSLVEPFAAIMGKGKKGEERTFAGDDKRTVDMQDNDFLIEAVIKPAGDGVIASKRDGTGYSLRLQGGKLVMELADGNGSLTATGPALDQDRWSHVVVEVDRAEGVRMAIDGVLVDVATQGAMPTGSLTNTGDFVVGEDLAAGFEFLRVSRGTLADARTTAEELHAWQFEGPFLQDFTGQPRDENAAAGAIATP